MHTTNYRHRDSQTHPPRNSYSTTSSRRQRDIHAFDSLTVSINLPHTSNTNDDTQGNDRLAIPANYLELGSTRDWEDGFAIRFPPKLRLIFGLLLAMIVSFGANFTDQPVNFVVVAATPDGFHITIVFAY